MRPHSWTADIVLAVNQACTNSIEHAYWRQRSGPVQISVLTRYAAHDVS